FDPPLPASKIAALDRIENGPISKVVLRFDRRFWPSDMSLLGNPGRQRRAGRSYFVPLYGAVSLPGGASSAILTALFNGNEARELDRRMSGRAEGDSGGGLPATVRARVDDYVRRNIMADLDEIFPGSAGFLTGWRVRSWANDPFTIGGTSFIRFEAGGRSRDAATVRQALADHLPTLPLYWAGEACALGTNPWSVHGAHQSGRAAARNVHAYLELPTG
ncbi:MAG: FAD-dependent oxidoreductase, partial [Phycisphaerales bacterium]|nr:FAD-dependent oxidoreductase [Phycisphaerales bacterium]